MQHLTREKLQQKKADRSESNFLEDPSVPELFRSTNKDYAYVITIGIWIANSIKKIAAFYTFNNYLIGRAVLTEVILRQHVIMHTHKML